MGSLASPGIGSGLNVNQLVSQLVAAERAPADRRIARQQADVQADLTAFGQIRGALTSLRTAANALDGSGASPGRRATVQQGAGFTATASPSAAVGRYTIEVESLAVAQKRQSAAVSETANLGSGTLTLTVGSSTFTINRTGSTTLAQLRDAINTATGGRGLSATVIKGDAGSQLVLNATTAGSAGAISVSGSGDLAGFAGGLAVTTAATDAVVKVDGITRTSSSNRLTDLIAGVTIDLTKAENDVTYSLEVAADGANVRTAVQSFITAYNGALSALRTASAYNAESRTGGPLVGDSAVRGLQQALRSAVGGAFDSLSALGIRSSKDGSLTLDAAKFDQALGADPSAVATLFDKDAVNSLGAVLAGRLDDAVAPNTGLLDTRTRSLNDRLKFLETDRQRLDVRIGRIEESYRRQFTALDGLVAQLQSTSSFLARELANLPGASNA